MNIKQLNTSFYIHSLSTVDNFIENVQNVLFLFGAHLLLKLDYSGILSPNIKGFFSTHLEITENSIKRVLYNDGLTLVSKQHHQVLRVYLR
jgi:hypothetical protein